VKESISPERLARAAATGGSLPPSAASSPTWREFGGGGGGGGDPSLGGSRWGDSPAYSRRPEERLNQPSFAGMTTSAAHESPATFARDGAASHGGDARRSLADELRGLRGGGKSDATPGLARPASAPDVGDPARYPSARDAIDAAIAHARAARAEFGTGTGTGTGTGFGFGGGGGSFPSTPATGMPPLAPAPPSSSRFYVPTSIASDPELMRLQAEQESRMREAQVMATVTSVQERCALKRELEDADERNVALTRELERLKRHCDALESARKSEERRRHEIAEHLRRVTSDAMRLAEEMRARSRSTGDDDGDGDDVDDAAAAAATVLEGVAAALSTTGGDSGGSTAAMRRAAVEARMYSPSPLKRKMQREVRVSDAIADAAAAVRTRGGELRGAVDAILARAKCGEGDAARLRERLREVTKAADSLAVAAMFGEEERARRA
jgi:hypothetical protein